MSVNHKKNAGFSLVEIMVSVAIVAILVTTLAPQLKNLINFQSAADTNNEFTALASAFQNAYAGNAMVIETSPLAQISFGALGTMVPSGAVAGGRCTATNAADFIPWSSYAGKSAAAMVNDGYGAPLCIFITPQMSVTVNGMNLFYHNVAFVSTGANNVLDNGTGLDANGNLLLAGDDTGVLFDGKSFATNQFQVSAAKMQAIVSLLGQYYNARYQSDPSRSSSVDYFSSGSTNSHNLSDWDSVNPGNVIPYDTLATPMYTTGSPTDMAVELSLAQNDVTDAYGNIISFENASNNVRNPDNGTASEAIPPFTALISTTLPGGAKFSEAVVGVNN